MECTFVFMGSVGAGKTEAIRCVSDITVVDTEADASDETARLKPTTTVAMDVGVMRLCGQDKLRLLGSPGQGRFDFMWEILLHQSQGVVLLVDHSRASALQDFLYYLGQIWQLTKGRMLPIVVGITHCDVDTQRPVNLAMFHKCHEKLQLDRGEAHHPLAVFQTDARCPKEVKILLMALTAMLDMHERFPVRQTVKKLHHG